MIVAVLRGGRKGLATSNDDEEDDDEVDEGWGSSDKNCGGVGGPWWSRRTEGGRAPARSCGKRRQ